MSEQFGCHDYYDRLLSSATQASQQQIDEMNRRNAMDSTNAWPQIIDSRRNESCPLPIIDVEPIDASREGRW